LISSIPSDPEERLNRKPLSDFIEDFLASCVFKEFFSNLKDRRMKDLPDRNPADLLALFHYGVDHLSKVIKDETLQEISWPVPEFAKIIDTEVPSDWNASFYVDPLVDVLEDLRLPEVFVVPTSNWSDLAQQIMTYVGALESPGIDSSVYLQSVSRSLARSYRSYVTKCSRLGEIQGDISVELLPWTNIIHNCIQLKINSIPEDLSSRIICYNEELLEDFRLPRSWTCGLGWGAEHREDSVSLIVEHSINEEKEKTFQEQFESANNSELMKSFSKEQRESMKFEDMLEKALSTDYIPRPSFNHSNLSMTVEVGGDSLMAYSSDGESNDESPCGEVEYVPLISYLSPSLGHLVSPLNLLTRAENIRTGMSPRNSSASRKTISSCHGGKRKSEVIVPVLNKKIAHNLSLDEELDNLKSQLSSDQDQDTIFEQRLQEALKN